MTAIEAPAVMSAQPAFTGILALPMPDGSFSYRSEFSVTEAAKFFGVSPKTVSSWIENRLIDAYHRGPGSKWYISAAAIINRSQRFQTEAEVES